MLTPEDMAEWLPRIPEIKQWLASFEEAALSTAYGEGKTIPGYKVVLSGGRRVWADEVAAMEALKKIGYGRDQITTTKIKGLGELEKLLGKPKFDGLLSGYLTRTEGRPSLVHDGDKRDAINSIIEAQKDFSDG